MLTGVVHPCSADALAGAVEAAEAGLIVPVLFGPEAEITAESRIRRTWISPNAASWPRTAPRTRR